MRVDGSAAVTARRRRENAATSWRRRHGETTYPGCARQGSRVGGGGRGGFAAVSAAVRLTFASREQRDADPAVAP